MGTRTRRSSRRAPTNKVTTTGEGGLEGPESEETIRLRRENRDQARIIETLQKRISEYDTENAKLRAKIGVCTGLAGAEECWKSDRTKLTDLVGCLEDCSRDPKQNGRSVSDE
jgi:hypothetical protein